MKISFYPGCSLEGMAKDYARSATTVFRQLEIDLIELKDWSCCGATAAHSLSEMMSVMLPARNLAIAETYGLDLVAPCANCFNRLRASQNMVKKKIFDIPWQVTGDIEIHDMTRFLAEPQMIKRVRARVQKSLKGLRVVCYPQTLDRLAAAAGAEVLDWSYKATCCGASIGIARRDIQKTLTQRLLRKVQQTGAEAVVVSCPLCQYNLDIIQMGVTYRPVPIFYFTELLRLAFVAEGRRKWFKTHFTNPVPLLVEKGLLK